MMNESSPVMEPITGNPPRILVVEDDPGITELLQSHLEYSMGAKVTIASNARDAIELDAEEPAEVIILDYMLPDMDGLELYSELNNRNQRPVILITGHPTLGRAIEALRLGASDMLVKPFDMDKLSQTLFAAIEKSRRTQSRIKRLIRMRQLAKNVLVERRSLRKKIDLVCRDIVGAYKELAEKFIKVCDKN
jgi:DNA-binding NtrC family response regulator